ncbi:MAG TPA: M56 family metallopeptidase, partial [Pirellulales bacterium]
MSNFAIELLAALGRTTLWLGLLGVITAAVLRVTRANSPTVHRVGCVLTLLVGWAFLRYPVAVPWYETAAVTASSGAIRTSPALIDLEPIAIPSADNSSEMMEGSSEVVDLATTEIAPQSGLQQSVVPRIEANDFSNPAHPKQSGAAPESIEPDRLSAAINLFPLIAAALWAVGLIAPPAIWLVGYVRFVRSVQNCRRPVDAWQSQWSELIATAPAGRQIPLCVSDDVGPMLCRLPRGFALVVPEPLWRELSDEGRRAILRHELAHYQRGDVWKSLAVRLLALPHWFNPVSWWAVRCFDEAAEWACDAAASSDQPSTEYAKTLVRLGELSTADLRYGSAARGRTLAARVRRVLAAKTQSDSFLKQALVLTGAVAVLMSSLLDVQLVARQPEKSDARPQLADTEQPSAGSTAEGQAKTDRQVQPGPTVSPYLNLLQKADDGKQGSESAAEDPGKEVTDASQKMVEQAERAFEASQAAYEAETTTLEAIYDWSLRWMRAVQNAAQTPKEKAVAASAHLERMQQLQKKIHLLYVSGSRGGEAKAEAAANYYVAEAERMVAEAKARSDASPAPAKPADGGSREQQISDAKVALAVDEAELRATEIRLKVARDKLATMSRAKPGVIASIELAQAKAEVQTQEASLAKFSAIRVLHQENLTRLQASVALRFLAESKGASQ